MMSASCSLIRRFEIDVDEVLAWRGSPVTEQSRLDLLRLERRAKQGIVKEIDLADAKIVCRSPVAIHLVQPFRAKAVPWVLRRSLFVLSIRRNRGRQAHVKDETRRVAKLIEVLAEGLRRVVFVNVDGGFRWLPY